MKKKIFSLELIIIPALGLLTFLLACLLGSWRFLIETFFHSFDDTFMDFFNSIRDAAKFNVYTQYHVIYSPLVTLYFMFCSFFIPDSALDHATTQYVMQRQPMSYVLLGIFLIVCFVLLFFALKRLLKKQSKAQIIFIYCLAIFSFPFLYTIERGNTLLLTFVLIVIFYAFYDGEKKYHKDIALLALALATTIKLYPVIFALILFKKKAWKDITKFGIFTTLLLFVPFIFYGGLEGLYIIIYSALNLFGEQLQFFSNVFLVLYYGVGVPLRIAKLVNYFVILLLVINFFLVKKQYQEYTILAIILMCISPGTYPYTSIFFLTSVFLLIKEERKGYLEIIYMANLLLLLTFNPLTWSLNVLTFVYMVVFYILHFVVIPIPIIKTWYLNKAKPKEIPNE